jgi:hypothetical protein
MKYLSVIFFTISLVWTWNVIHSKSDVSFETHSGIQEKLGGLIRDSILAKKPTATEITIEKIWTEKLTKDKVKASFIYSYKDNSEEGVVTTRIAGQGYLEKKPDEGDSNHWILTDFATTSDNIEFNDATLVTGSGTSSEENPVIDEAKSEEKKGSDQ